MKTEEEEYNRDLRVVVKDKSNGKTCYWDVSVYDKSIFISMLDMLGYRTEVTDGEYTIADGEPIVWNQTLPVDNIFKRIWKSLKSPQVTITSWTR